MLCVHSRSSDPYFNLATEEYLLKETDREYFLTYINEPSIIVGKHQNAYAEINFDYVHKNKIKVARRLTGGGTVFHDQGNLNFTFIVNGKEGELVDFKTHTRPVIDFLASLSVKAEFAGKNDLLMDGLKISGNAEHVFRNRVLHHGTLLFDSKLTDLSEALKVNPMKYHDKAVRSVRSKVSNISCNLQEDLSITQLRDRLMAFIRKEKSGQDYNLAAEAMDRIKTLRDEKFSTWEWNFGYAPKYSLIKTIIRNGKLADINMEVVKGGIEAISMGGDLFDDSCKKAICKALVRNQHHYDRMLNILKEIADSGCFVDITPEELVHEFF